MSFAILKKSMLVYKPIMAWNILLDLIIGLFFVIDGTDKPGAYAMLLFTKPVGWGFSIFIERLFLRKNSYFYKNMGLDWPKIFRNIIIYDVITLALIIVICLLTRNFLLTVLPINITNKQF